MNVIQQLSVFIPNESGNLNRACQVLGKNHINIITLSLADTQEYGILRLLVHDAETARKLLAEAGFMVKTTPVLAVPVPHQPGGLAGVLEILSANKLDLLYMYAFPEGKLDRALMVFRFGDPARAQAVLESAGFAPLAETDLL